MHSSVLTLKDTLVFVHAGFGLLVIIAALWVFVETLHVQASNEGRIRFAADATAFFCLMALLFGGYWYLHFYPIEKALILRGKWPFAHQFFMETKEHLFFVTLILSLYLPIAARDAIATNRAARKMLLVVSLLIVLLAISIEGAGAVISYGAKVALLPKLQQ